MSPGRVADPLKFVTSDSAERDPEFGIRIPFTKDPMARAAANKIIMALLISVPKEAYVHPATRNAIAAKVAAYLTKTGRQSRDAIELFNWREVVDAIQQHPRLIAEPVGLAGIIRIHRQHSWQAAARLRRLLGNIPPRPTVWRNDAGTCRIDEAVDPRHLQEDSAILRHCVGTLYNKKLLASRGLTLADPAAIHCLKYWDKIMRGKIRILSLVRSNQIVATLEVNCATKSIVQFEPKLWRGDTTFDELLDGLQALELDLMTSALYNYR